MGVFVVVIVLAICMILWYKNKEEKNLDEQRREEHSKQIQDFSEKWRQNEFYQDILKHAIEDLHELVKKEQEITRYREKDGGANTLGWSSYNYGYVYGVFVRKNSIELESSTFHGEAESFSINPSSYNQHHYSVVLEGYHDLSNAQIRSFCITIKEDIGKALPALIFKESETSYYCSVQVGMGNYRQYIEKKEIF